MAESIREKSRSEDVGGKQESAEESSRKNNKLGADSGKRKEGPEDGMLIRLQELGYY